MKKVKIMLTAITVFAVVGGALAFKAAKFTAANVYCSTFASPNTCQKQTPSFQTTVNGVAQNDPCGSSQDFFIDNTCRTAKTTIPTDPTFQAIYTTVNP